MKLSVPDPFDAAPLPPRPARQVEVQRQWKLRAGILATTRRLLAEHGYDGLKVSQIALTHGVTDQTIYNNFGPKFEVVRHALEDHSDLMNLFAWDSCRDRELFPILLFLIYYQGAVCCPDFYRQMMLCSFAGRHPLFPHLHKHGTKIKISPLREMARGGLFRPSVDPIALSDQITRLNSYALYEWANDAHDFCDLYGQLINGNTLLLLGALERTRRAPVEKWLADFEDHIVGDPIATLEAGLLGIRLRNPTPTPASL